MAKALWHFQWNCGRQGIVEGLFVETDEEVKKYIGQDVYFGEILGKHSDIEGTLDEADLQRITDDPAFIAMFESLFDSSFGYNPMQYIKDREDNGEFSEEDE